ncbi:MAG TPA: hypothetical protein VFT65_09985 [Candidatus Angelobacter sp.]|nr:hypothetical protein [Candidatus Angelobacter sp.]
MPNGGPDNCSTCGFNRRNRGIWRNPAPIESDLPYCEIRGLPVLFEHWTYCQNWHSRTRSPIGPIYASGVYEGGYHRIPWHGAVEPESISSGGCVECAATVVDGISIAALEGAPLAFCCNLHYLQWWKRQHPNEDAPMSEGIWEL